MGNEVSKRCQNLKINMPYIFVIFPPDLKEMYSVMILHYYFTQKVHFEFLKLNSELKIEISFSTISAI